MKQLLPILLAFPLLLLAAAQPANLPPDARPLPPTPAAAQPAFRTLRIFLDPHGKPLAAYQFQLAGDPGLTIVGIETGAVKGFTDPPYYDPAALAGGRIIVGAYSLAQDLPATPTHVATLHVRLAHPDIAWKAKLITAGTRDGTPIACDILISEGEQP